MKATDDGWLNRAMQSMPEPQAVAVPRRRVRPVSCRARCRAPRSAVAIPDLKQFKMNGPQQTVEGGFEAMYAQTVDQAMRGVGNETFEAIDQLKKINPDTYKPANGAEYPKSRFGQSLMEIAELFKADVGLEVAFLDSGGWDHHVNEGGAAGPALEPAARFGAGNSGVPSGHGRPHGRHRVREHVRIRPHRARERQPRHRPRPRELHVRDGRRRERRARLHAVAGLDEGQLNQGRDLAVTTDYRSVLGEVIYKHLGDRDLAKVFPGFANDPSQFLGVCEDVADREHPGSINPQGRRRPQG